MDPKLPNRPDKTRSADVPGMVEAGFTCGLCGGLAAWVSLVAAGAPEPESWAREAPFTIGTARIGVEAGPLSCRFGGEVVDSAAPAAAAALREGDAAALYATDLEFAPFWCPTCAASYCGRHWSTWPVWDPELDGFLDEIRGHCPRGHERMIMD